MWELFEYDNKIRKDYPVICGVDEAGRGPLCGPVCCAAVILPPDFLGDGIDDSKKLTEKKREYYYTLILDNCLSFSSVLVPPKTIDKINILNATMCGMSQTVKELSITPDIVLIDGNRVPEDMEIESKSIIKGDGLSLSIAAASIIAKVTRDRYMEELDREYPQYMLAKNKGYPTKQHYELIEKYGIQDFYRKSFFKNRQDLLWKKD